MIVRSFNFETDYNDTVSWWKKQDWKALPQQMLSPTGFIAEDGETKIAATWIYKTNCPLYIMEWTIGNPDINWEDRAKGINMVIDAACDWAKQDGANIVVTMANNERFLEKLKDNKFKVTDIGMTHLMRSL